MEHFNKLTPAETEALDILAEECAEVIQAISKIKRHGLDSFHPVSGITNMAELACELGDVLAAVMILQINVENTVIQDASLTELAAHKFKRIAKYTHHVRLKP